MTVVDEIQAAISRLDPDERRQLATWLEQHLGDLDDGLAAQAAEREPGANITHEALLKELGATG